MDVLSGVSNQRSEGELALQWGEVRQVISHARLRGACPCSQCRAARLRGGISLVAEDVRIERIELQGYGLQLMFSDGHDRGIYPWAYLRELQ